MGKTILDEAAQCVTSDRGNQYGPPEQDFTRTADMVTALLGDKLRDGARVSAPDVARVLLCVKLSRSTWSPKRDNWVDIAGYAACGFRCENGHWGEKDEQLELDLPPVSQGDRAFLEDSRLQNVSQCPYPCCEQKETE